VALLAVLLVLLFGVRPLMRAVTGNRRQPGDEQTADRPATGMLGTALQGDGGPDRSQLAAQIELAQRIVREQPDDALLALRRMLGDRRREHEATR
jgi:flagellar M-ring protein FliF